MLLLHITWEKYSLLMDTHEKKKCHTAPEQYKIPSYIWIKNYDIEYKSHIHYTPASFFPWSKTNEGTKQLGVV